VLVKVKEGDDACVPEQCLEELALKGVAVGRWLRHRSIGRVCGGDGVVFKAQSIEKFCCWWLSVL
jgi:hypothetical protein